MHKMSNGITRPCVQKTAKLATFKEGFEISISNGLYLDQDFYRVTLEFFHMKEIQVFEHLMILPKKNTFFVHNLKR